MIGRQVVHMTRLVDDLLDISRITHGKIELSRENVDLVAVALRAVEATRHRVDARRHELVVTLPGLPLNTCADPARVLQIVANLLDNAAKYTPQGGRIELALRQRGSDALLTVRDNGEGIAPELLASIFEPFTQVAGPARGAHGGLGIGLTLVRRLVELHGGDIQARSGGPGEGSEFSVRLPMLEAPIVDRVSSAPPSLPQAPLRILVVDDNVDAAVALAQMLRAWGHTVRVSHDGSEALQAHAIFGPDVVLLDLGLPGIDGVEVGRRMRQSARGEPLLIVAITGFGQRTDRQRTTEAGFDEHFTKPVAVPVLQRLLHAWADATRRAPPPHRDTPSGTAASAV
jgi:CheY-like chemotaxis protein/two-component sensor histidine kinase